MKATKCKINFTELQMNLLIRASNYFISYWMKSVVIPAYDSRQFHIFLFLVLREAGWLRETGTRYCEFTALAQTTMTYFLYVLEMGLHLAFGDWLT